MHARMRTQTFMGADARTCPRVHTCTHVRTQELLDLYNKIEHTKKMGIVYAGNTVTRVVAGILVMTY